MKPLHRETRLSSCGTEDLGADENAPPGCNPLASPLSQGGAVQQKERVTHFEVSWQREPQFSHI